jgi:hypothetical protein
LCIGEQVTKDIRQEAKPWITLDSAIMEIERMRQINMMLRERLIAWEKAELILRTLRSEVKAWRNDAEQGTKETWSALVKARAETDAINAVRSFKKE